MSFHLDEDAIQRGVERVRLYERRKRRIFKVTQFSSIAVVILVASGLFLNAGPRTSDTIQVQEVSCQIFDTERVVYTEAISGDSAQKGTAELMQSCLNNFESSRSPKPSISSFEDLALSGEANGNTNDCVYFATISRGGELVKKVCLER